VTANMLTKVVGGAKFEHWLDLTNMLHVSAPLDAFDAYWCIWK